MIETRAVLTWAVGALSAAGTDITAYHGAAPEDAPEPWTILALGAGEDTNTGGNDRGYAEIPLLVRISSPGTSGAQNDALAAKADLALHGKNATVEGRSIHCARIGSTAFTTVEEGETRQVVALTYRVTVR